MRCHIGYKGKRNRNQARKTVQGARISANERYGRKVTGNFQG